MQSPVSKLVLEPQNESAAFTYVLTVRPSALPNVAIPPRNPLPPLPPYGGGSFARQTQKATPRCRLGSLSAAIPGRFRGLGRAAQGFRPMLIQCAAHDSP